ncbi:MAG: FAD binding domain-containing protein [Candidatus Omnitrophica bacterium]|nr:FAD binding domain-containing protein [Candidatus Omnitrophota bacterium]
MAILKDFQYHAPESVDEALDLLRRSGKPVLLAGGTFVLNTLKKAVAYPTDVIALRKIKALQGIADTGEGISIGAMTLLSDIASSPLIRERASVLARAAACVATTPLRHMGTIGGNVASRFFWVDLPAALVAVGAKVEWAAGSGKKVLDIEKFLALKGPDAKGILVRFLIAEKHPVGEYFRHTQAMEVDLPLAALAFAARKQADGLKDVRLAVNTALSPVVRLKSVESLFENTKTSRLKEKEAAAALRRDLEGGKLDDYRLQCLCGDMEALVERLKRAKT